VHIYTLTAYYSTYRKDPDNRVTSWWSEKRRGVSPQESIGVLRNSHGMVLVNLLMKKTIFRE
jgi:hypothetical protein